MYRFLINMFHALLIFVMALIFFMSTVDSICNIASSDKKEVPHRARMAWMQDRFLRGGE